MRAEGHSLAEAGRSSWVRRCETAQHWRAAAHASSLIHRGAHSPLKSSSLWNLNLWLQSKPGRKVSCAQKTDGKAPILSVSTNKGENNNKSWNDSMCRAVCTPSPGLDLIFTEWRCCFRHTFSTVKEDWRVWCAGVCVFHMHMDEFVCVSVSVCHQVLCPWDSPGKITASLYVSYIGSWVLYH